MMESVVFEKIGNKSEGMPEGCYRLFGFAVNDYIADYGIDPKELEDEYLFAAVLNDYDVDDDLKRFIEILTSAYDVSIIIFDISDLDEDAFQKLRGYGEVNGFAELKDVYEDRIVFVSEESSKRRGGNK